MKPDAGRSAETIDVDAVQRRTLGTLVAAQAVGAVGITIGIATASILAEQISGSEKLAGLAQTAQVLGAALASYLLARIMGERGRRPGLLIGYALGATGALLCVVAGATGWFWLLLVGATLLGSTTAANSQSRYAATDLAEDSSRARALSVVVWATTVGAVAGPNLAGPAGRLARALGLPELTGPFVVGVVGMAAAALVISVFLRPDPLLTARHARAVAAADQDILTGPTQTSWGRVRTVLATRPLVGAGIAGLALSHAVMVAVMVMTPLHMHHGGADLQLIGVVISVHVLGMFAFAPLVGWAADRWGRGQVLMGGAVVQLLAVLIAGSAPEGPSWRIGLGLFLLGLGWSGANIAASTLLSEATPWEARTDVQGAADLIMGVSAAVAGGLSGVLVGWLGFGGLNLAAGVLAAGAGYAGWRACRTPRGARVPG